MQGALSVDQDCARKLAFNWLQQPGHTQDRLAEAVRKKQSDISRFLNRPEELGPSRRHAIAESVMKVCSVSRWGPVSLDLLSKTRLEARFSGVQFWPVDDDVAEVIGLVAASLVQEKMEQLTGCSDSRPVLLTSGGPTVQECVTRLRAPDMRAWSSVAVGPLNGAKWSDARRRRRGAEPMSEAIGIRFNSHLLDRAGVESTANRPGVALLSGGGSGGFAAQWLTRNHVAVPHEFVGDLNFCPLVADGSEVDDRRISSALLPLRYWPNLREMRAYLANKTVILTLSDARYRDPRDNPPPGSTKAPLLRACLATSIADVVVLDAKLGRRIIIEGPLGTSEPRRPAAIGNGAEARERTSGQRRYL